MSDLEKKVHQLAEKAVLKLLGDPASWLMPNYENRLKVPPEIIHDAWAMVDVEAIKKQFAERIEQELANRLVNHIAAEIATDIKQLLSVQERREALRAVARENLERICKSVKPE